MAGYSGTPLASKLGIKGGSQVALLHAPDGFEAQLEPLPSDVRTRRRLGPTSRSKGRSGPDLDVIVAFITERAHLERAFDRVTAALQPAGGLWIAWPKKASKVPTDMTEDVVREIALPKGWVDNKVCAIDETWSGLRLVLRKELRPKS